MNKWINLNKLVRKNDLYDWKKSIGLEIDFIYDDIVGIVKILNTEDKYVFINYLNSEYKMHKNSFINCAFGNLTGKISFEYKLNIGDKIVDSKRNILITERTILKNKDGSKCRAYKYVCNDCGFKDGVIREFHILNRNGGCSCCGNSKSISYGINDFYSNYPELAKYMENPEDGKKIPCHGINKIKLKCPDCGTVSSINISYYIKRGGFSCVKCGDGMTFPNKFIYNVLEQLGTHFINEKSFDWSLRKRYDFYIPSLNCIIEAHGQQHYNDAGFMKNHNSNDIENDNIKRNLALNNGIDYYIEIDCSKSDCEFIKNNIYDSELSKLCNLSNVNWSLCNEFSSKSLVRKVCEYKRDNNELTAIQIAKIFNMSPITCVKYLKQGSKIWDWINYDPKFETDRCNERKKVTVELFDNDISVGIFSSFNEMIDKSIKLFGFKFDDSSFRKCMKRNKKYRGRFRYIKI